VDIILTVMIPGVIASPLGISKFLKLSKLVWENKIVPNYEPVKLLASSLLLLRTC